MAPMSGSRSWLGQTRTLRSAPNATGIGAAMVAAEGGVRSNAAGLYRGHVMLPEPAGGLTLTRRCADVPFPTLPGQAPARLGASPVMPYAQLNSVKLYYERAGLGDPPLLFVPGWCCDQRFYAPQFEHFQKAHDV